MYLFKFRFPTVYRYIPYSNNLSNVSGKRVEVIGGNKLYAEVAVYAYRRTTIEREHCIFKELIIHVYVGYHVPTVLDLRTLRRQLTHIRIYCAVYHEHPALWHGGALKYIKSQLTDGHVVVCESDRAALKERPHCTLGPIVPKCKTHSMNYWK